MEHRLTSHTLYCSRRHVPPTARVGAKGCRWGLRLSQKSKLTASGKVVLDAEVMLGFGCIVALHYRLATLYNAILVPPQTFSTNQAHGIENPQMDFFWLGRIATEPNHKRTRFA